MEIVSILLYIILFLSTLLSLLKKQKHGIHFKKFKLPPGSMGWPYVGETLQLYSQDPNIFFLTKQKRYGEIFKTHILGCPCVMLASPEAARFVLVTHAHLFKPTYPKSKERLIGPHALFFHRGGYHARLRRLVQNSLAPQTIKKLIPDIQGIAVSTLESWAASGQVVNTFYEMKKLSFDVGILSIFGHIERGFREMLEENYRKVDKGYNSFPTNIPGTAYQQAILARKRLNRILGEIISSRKEKRLLEKDMLGHFLSFKDENDQKLSDEQIADNIIGVLFAAQDTTASVITWVLKFLHDDPKLLEAVKVVMESLRMASIISFTFREAVVDVDYKGYLIPKGWKVAPKANTFMPFGNGVHACPGNELAKLEALILIHHLVTNFRCEVVSSKSGIQYGPFPVPQQGLPARFWKEPKQLQS
ncbi:hypothetical protein GOBAR_AA20266 [Gossypium barbadense]|uniref:Abscisic acid 8'-hydroxylase 4-like n=1 Tax=Gossypium barbadense TaxID=3634 RepID=A0A2P5XAL0_GOSBA|nr:hypothetical protein GOBAR_AA20266 [Gossypium barbadense]